MLNPNEVDDTAVLNWEFPWIASIYRQLKDGQYRYTCSGSLIHPQVVLTTSSCVAKVESDKFKVVVNGKNEVTRKITSESFAGERNVSLILQHPEYNSTTQTGRNHIALLFLNKPYNISSENPINLICLPSQNHKFENSSCMVAAGGQLPPNEDIRKLIKLPLPLVEHDLCQEQLRNILGNQFELHDSFLCAGGEGRPEPCAGDGGSPLMCQINNSYYLAGMVSWGVGCNQHKVPSGFTDVAKFHGWIFSEVTKGKFNM